MLERALLALLASLAVVSACKVQSYSQISEYFIDGCVKFLDDRSIKCQGAVCEHGAECLTADGYPYCECPPCRNVESNRVCASDGAYYDNECEMNFYACRRQRKLTVVDNMNFCYERNEEQVLPPTPTRRRRTTPQPSTKVTPRFTTRRATAHRTGRRTSRRMTVEPVATTVAPS